MKNNVNQKSIFMKFSFRQMFLLLKRRCVTDKVGLIVNSSTSFLVGIALALLGGSLLADRIFGIILTSITCSYMVMIAMVSFYEYRTKGSRIFAINLPATVSEKYFAELIYTLIVCSIPMFLSAFAGLLLGDVLSGNSGSLTKHLQNIFSFLTFESWTATGFFAVLSVVSLIWFVSLLFKKNLLSTVVLIFVCIGGLFYAGLYFSQMTLESVHNNMMVDFCYFDYYYVVGNILSTYISWILPIVSIFLLTLTFFALKKERA